MQSTLLETSGLHVEIIMDGNGRWAERRGKPRTAGHRAGVAALRRTIEAAPPAGIGTLTVFAFSADNWSRPAEEVEALMVLLSTYLARETRRLADAGVRLEVIGRRDRLADGLVRAIKRAEAATASGDKLHLRVALDYSGRDAIVVAASRCGLTLTREKFARKLKGTTPDVDLMIRTGGEQRLSDFLLWECAYAELMFSDLMWPDFDGAALDAAVVTFRGRTRRFGGLAAAPAAA